MIYVYLYRHTTLWERSLEISDITFADLGWEVTKQSNDNKPVTYALRPDLEKLMSIQLLLQKPEIVQWLKSQGKNMLMFMESDISSPSPIVDTDYFIFYQRGLDI